MRKWRCGAASAALRRQLSEVTGHAGDRTLRENPVPSMSTFRAADPSVSSRNKAASRLRAVSWCHGHKNRASDSGPSCRPAIDPSGSSFPEGRAKLTLAGVAIAPKVSFLAPPRIHTGGHKQSIQEERLPRGHAFTLRPAALRALLAAPPLD